MEDSWEPPKRITVSYDAPTQILYNQIKDHDIEVQVAVAANLNGSKRAELFDIIANNMPDPWRKKNIEITKDRLEMACLDIPEYSKNEVEHYKDIFVNDFSGLIHSPNIADYIDDKLRDLKFLLERLQMDIKDGIRDGQPYTFLEDRELNQNDIIETGRYKTYLEILRQRFDPTAKKVELKKDGQTIDSENIITARMIGRFCKLVDASGVKKKGNLTIEPFCMDVCQAYKLQYSDNVRQWFSKPIGSKYDNDIIALILPKIPPSAAKRIKQYLGKKNPPNQKVYG